VLLNDVGNDPSEHLNNSEHRGVRAYHTVVSRGMQEWLAGKADAIKKQAAKIIRGY
jgi:hypothetical protein